MAHRRAETLDIHITSRLHSDLSTYSKLAAFLVFIYLFTSYPSIIIHDSMSTQPLTEMSTRNLPGIKGRLAYKDDKLATLCEFTAYKT